MLIEKKQIYTGLALAAIAGGALYFYRLRQLGEQLQYRIVKISRNKATNAQQASITVDMELINPTDGSFNARGMYGTIIYGNSVLATMQSKKPFTIKPGKTMISLLFTTNNKAILINAVQAAMDKKLAPIKVNYNINTWFGSIPQSFTINPGDLL
jgi:hypothetical protein